MERGTVSSTDGYDLSLIAGGATSGGYSKAGGDLYLSSGISTGDASSNIYFQTAGDVFGAAGTTDLTPTTKMAITGSGSVGIGTTSPGARLDLSGDMRIKSTSDTGYGTEISTLGVSGTYGYSTTIFQALGYSASYPSYRLVVATPAGSGDAGGGVLFRTGTTMNGQIVGNPSGLYLDVVGSTSPMIFRTSSSSTERMRISSNGNVGIGTTGPGYKLEVAGNVSVGTDLYLGTNNLLKGSSSYFDINVGTTATLNTYGRGIIIRQAQDSTGVWGNIGLSNSSVLSIGMLNGVGNGSNLLSIKSNGYVGIGTTAPRYLLDVIGSGTSGVASFLNTTTGTGRTQPTLIVQTYNTGLGTSGAELIRFLNSEGTKIGRVRLATSTTVNFASSSTADFAEFVFGDEPVEASDLVSYHPNGKFGKARSGDIIAGAYSNIGVFTGNESIAEEPNAILLTLVGVIDLKVSSQNGSINPGDPISTSHLAGVGAKAIKAGRIVGQAMESYSNSDINQIGLIKVMVQPSWYDPDVFLTDTGQVAINYNVSDEVLSSLGYSGTKNEIEAATYSLTDSLGHAVTQVGQFGKLAAAKMETAYLSAKSIVVDNLAAKRVASETIITGDITGTEALFDSATIGSLTAESIGASQASFSTVYADQIINPEGNISEVFATKISDLREEIKSFIASSSAQATPSAIALESATWDTSVATESADLVLDNLTLSDSLVIASQLTVGGHSSLNTASVTGTFTVGQIALSDNIMETTAQALYIQPSGLGSVHILNDRLVLSNDGSVTINGNLNVTGSLIAEMIKANSVETKDLTAEKINITTSVIASDSATISSPIIAADASPSAEASFSATLASNATVGTVTLAAGQTEITIQNPHLTPSSMVYLTPSGSTGNQVVYIKNKTSNSFAIAIDQPLTQNVDINWWLIN